MSSPGQRLKSIRERLAMLSQIDPNAIFTPQQLERRKKLYSYSTPRLAIPPIQRFIKTEDETSRNDQPPTKSKFSFNFGSIELPPSEQPANHHQHNQEKHFEVEAKPEQAYKNDHQEQKLYVQNTVFYQTEIKKEKDPPQQEPLLLNLTVKNNTPQVFPQQGQNIQIPTIVSIQNPIQNAQENADFTSPFSSILKAPQSQRKDPIQQGQFKKTSSFDSYPQQKEIQTNKRLQFNRGPFQRVINSQEASTQKGSTNNLFSGARMNIIENNNYRISSSQIVQPQKLPISAEKSAILNEGNDKPNFFFKQSEPATNSGHLKEVISEPNKPATQIPQKRLNFFTNTNQQLNKDHHVQISTVPAANIFNRKAPEERPNVSRLISNEVQSSEIRNDNQKQQIRKEEPRPEPAIPAKQINIFSRKLPEPKEEIKKPIMEAPNNIFKPKEANNIFRRQVPATNIFKAASPGNIFISQSTAPPSIPSTFASQPNTKSEKISNIFAQNRQENIFSKSQQIERPANIFGQKPSQNEGNLEEGDEQANSQNEGYEEEEDKFDPTLSTGRYDYVSSNVIFKAAVSKCRIQKGELIENVVISLEKFEKPDAYLYVRMSNKCIKLCAKILRGVTSISKAGQNKRNIVISRLLNTQNANPADPKLITLKLQFGDEESGDLLISKAQEYLLKNDPSASQ